MIDINSFLLKILPKSFDVTYVIFNQFNYKKRFYLGEQF